MPQNTAVHPSATITQIQAIQTGPLPSAEEMKRYQEVFPELPQRIFEMAQQEQKHRFEREQEAISQRRYELQANKIIVLVGIIVSFLITSVIMAAAVSCAFLHHPLTAGFIGTGGIVMIVLILVRGSQLHSSDSK